MKKYFNKTFKYCLRPTREQRLFFAQSAGAARFVYNFGLEQVKSALDARAKIPTYYDLAKKLTRMKLDKQWLYDVHSQTLQEALKNLIRSVEAWSKGRHKSSSRQSGFPKFKSKGRSDSFRYPQSIRCESGRVYLPKIGWVKYRDSRPIEGEIKQATVKLEGEKWYVSITVEIEREIQALTITEDKVVGIDVGLIHIITTSYGEQTANPRHLLGLLEKVKYASQSLTRKKKGSNNWKKCRDRLRRLYIKISNMRADFLHKLSKMLTESQGALMICVENLNIQGMVKNQRLSRSISDASWGILYKLLEYKCLWQGKAFVQIDRYYPSSKQCSACGNKQEMPLSIREFDCKACGLKLDRDINAAINLRLAGITKLKAYGGKIALAVATK